MNIVKVLIYEDDYNELSKHTRSLMQVESVEPDKIDYPDDEQWKQLKNESLKAYKKLKEYEFKKRHNIRL